MGSFAWDDAREDWFVDGGLRDIYVFETTRADEKPVVDVLRATYGPTRFSFGEESHESNLRPHPDVLISCYFADGVQFDVDPREIVGQAEFDVICEFVLVVGRALGRQVDVTGENDPSTVFMRYEPETDTLVRVPPEPPLPLLDRLRGDG